MRYEHYTQPILPFRKWLHRLLRTARLALVIAAVALSVGILGYHFLGNLDWVDSILEASMILGGMGPVAPMNNNAVKLFASAYALMSGLVIIGTTGLLLAPWLHRMLHYFYQGKK